MVLLSRDFLGPAGGSLVRYCIILAVPLMFSLGVAALVYRRRDCGPGQDLDRLRFQASPGIAAVNGDIEYDLLGLLDLRLGVDER